MSTLHRAALAGLALFMSGAGAPQPGEPPLDAVVRVIGPDGEDRTLGAMMDVVAQADVVFLGETHLDDVTHRVELAVLEGLAARRGGRVVLALEMFATDVQPVIDRYLAGDIDEETFLREARPWPNYRTGYRALVEYARAHKLPVIGSNVPAGLRQAIAAGGREALESLPDEERALVPPELLPNSPTYWRRFRHAVAGHMDADDQGGEPDPMSFLYSSQSLWDNTMGWSCARALALHPGSVVLHVNGGFHSKYGQGTVEQVDLRLPGVAIATISVIPASDLLAVDVRDAGRAADFLVFAEARGRGLEEGFHAASASREVRYRIRLPEAASDAAPAPLLIWLTEEGLRASDAEAHWRAALGDTAALVAVEPPYLQVEDDLHLGGRWYWTETFHDDTGTMVQAIERILSYVTAHFPVDPSRVVVGGAGTGATVLLVAALLSDRLPVEVIALDPRETSKLAEVSLPDLPPVTESLTVLAVEPQRNRWEETCGGYAGAGLESSVVVMSGDGYADARRLVRAKLGLDDRPDGGPSPDGGGPSPDSAVERHWIRLLALRGLLRPAGPISVEDLGGAAAIPVPAGPFGGTTVVVLPPEAPAAVRDGWRELGQGGAMQEAHGRFHRLAVALQDEAPRLADVLGELEAKGRRNVLIVPAVFHAKPGRMRELRGQAAGYRDRMTLSWLPGLGGCLATSPPVE